MSEFLADLTTEDDRLTVSDTDIIEILDGIANGTESAADLFRKLLHPDASFYGRVVYLGVISASASILNSVVLYRLIGHIRGWNAHLFTLQFCLCICDLITSALYTGIQVGNVASISFNGGQFLCKMVKSIEVWSVFMSSNITACIALNRALTLVYPAALARRAYERRVKFMALGSLGMSVICSVPNFFMWRVTTLAYKQEIFSQCEHVSVFEEEEGQMPMENSMFWKIYSATSIILRFWLSLAVITISYGVIFHHVGGCGMRTKEKKSGRIQIRIGRETTSDLVLIKPLQCQLSQPTITNSLSQPRALRRQLGRLRKLTGLLVLSYVILWLPYNILTVWYYIQSSPELLEVSSWLADFFLIKCVLNPLMWLLIVFRYD